MHNRIREIHKNDMTLESSIALVTGGSVRIGRAICEALAGKGCVVAVHYNRSETEARQLVASLRADGAKAFTVRGDLMSAEQCGDIIRQACSEAGRLDILVNNAAVFHKDTLQTADDEQLLSELQVNMAAPRLLTSAFVAAREAAPRAVDGRKGKIINLLDRRIAGVDPESLSYSISKKMLAEFTREAAVALAPDIAVNGVAPGSILPPPIDAGQRTREAAGHVPLNVNCTPADVADAVIYLLETDAVTGQVIFVDGGQHLGSQ